MTAPVVRPWQWQDHPTRWAPGDRITVGVTCWERIRRGGWIDLTGLGYVSDAYVDEWIMCGRAVPLVEHGNPIAGRP